MLSRRSWIVLGVISVIIIQIASLPIIRVNETRFSGDVPKFLEAYAQTFSSSSVTDLQIQLEKVDLNIQSQQINASSATISLKGMPQPDGKIKLDVNLDMKDLSVRTKEVSGRLGRGVMTGFIIVDKDNKMIIQLTTNASIVDILRGLIGV